MPDIQFIFIGVVLCCALLTIWYTIWILCGCDDMCDDICSNGEGRLRRVGKNRVHLDPAQSDIP